MRSELGEAEAVGQRVDLAALLAHRAVAEGVRLVAGQVGGGEEMGDRVALDLVLHAEHGGDPLGDAAVVGDAFERAVDRLAGGDRGEQQEHVPAGEHRDEVVAEDHLPVGVELGGDDENVLFAVDRCEVIFGELLRQERADDLAAVHADDRVDGLLIGVVLRERDGRLARHHEIVLHHRDVDVVVDVGMARDKVAGNRGDLQVAVAGRYDFNRIHNHSCSSILRTYLVSNVIIPFFPAGDKKKAAVPGIREKRSPGVRPGDSFSRFLEKAPKDFLIRPASARPISRGPCGRDGDGTSRQGRQMRRAAALRLNQKF